MRRLLLALLLAAPLAGAGLAQPYAADGGFGRPVLEESRAIAASVSVAVSNAGTVTTVWAGPEGVWRVNRTEDGSSQAELVAATDDVRTLSAAYVGQDLVLTWVSRDRSTGRYHYRALLDGATRELFDDSLIVDLHLFDYEGEPFAAGLFRRGGEGQLRLIDLRSGDERVVYRTTLTQRGLDVLPVQGGGLWLGWLEGRNERGEFGLISEWDAFVGLLPAPGAELAGPAGLGSAFVEDERMSVALLSDEPAAAGSPGVAGGVWVLWADEEADLRLTEVAHRAGQLSEVATSEPVGRGRPVGASWPDLYWVSDTSVMRQSVHGGEPMSVALSPVTMEGVEFTTGTITDGGQQRELSAIAWYGRVKGGAIQIYSMDDREPMERTFTDRLAALMGWNPWHMWDEFIGQALTAILVGVIAGTALVPLLLILGPLLGRLLTRQRPALVIGLVAGVLPFAGAVVLYNRAFATPADAGLFYGAVAGALLVAALLGWLVGRTGDREAQGTFTVVGAVAAVTGITLFSFITYPQWAPALGLV